MSDEENTGKRMLRIVLPGKRESRETKRKCKDGIKVDMMSTSVGENDALNRTGYRQKIRCCDHEEDKPREEEDF